MESRWRRSKAGESSALRFAAENGHVKCEKLLMPLSNVNEGDSLVPRRAAINGHAKSARVLLPAWGSREMADEVRLLEEAVALGHANVEAVLIEEELGLFDWLDLSKCLALAREKCHCGIAECLSSIMDKKDLLRIVPEKITSGVGRASL